MTSLINIVRQDVFAFLESNNELLFNERDFQMHLATWLRNSQNRYDDVDVEYYVPKSELDDYVWDSELRLDIVVEKEHVNVIDSISAGANDGMKVGISVTAMIIALVALVAMIDWMFGGLGNFLYSTCHLGWTWLPDLSLKFILGKIFAVFALVMGVPLQDITTVGGLMGEKIVLNRTNMDDSQVSEFELESKVKIFSAV